MNKRLTRLLLALCMVASAASPLYAQDNETLLIQEQEMNEVAWTMHEMQFDLKNQTITLDGKAYEKSGMPKEIEGILYLPVRNITEELIKAYVTWEKEGTFVRINRQQHIVCVELGSNEAQVADQTVVFEGMPFMENDQLYLPADFMAEAFELSVERNQDVITVKGEDKRLNRQPEAGFIFKNKHLKEGQNAEVIMTSRDHDGDELINQLWRINEGEETYSSFEEAFKTLKTGTFQISVKVQDARGLWSEWTTQTLHIEANRAPKITSLETDKKSYKCGEPVNISYTYDNEEDEDIINEKWMYYKLSEGESTAVLGKPDAFFTPGDYVITLEIDDAKNKRSEKQSVNVHIIDQKVESEFNYHFTKSDIGDIIDNFGDFNFRSYQDAELVNTVLDAGSLLMSDSPETVLSNGVLYEDTLEGEGRVLIHHLNMSDSTIQNQKFAIVAVNETEETVHFKTENESLKGPATDIGRVGQVALYDYLAGSEAKDYTLTPGEQVVLYEKSWSRGGCVSGLFDLETDGPVKFMVLAMGNDDSYETLDEMERLQSEGKHPCGTFETLNINYEINVPLDAPSKFLFGAGGNEEWVNGIDVRTQTEVENKGNFGVLYRLTFTAEEDMGIILNSRGSGIRGAISWGNGEVYNVPVTGALSKTTRRAAVIGVIKKGETKTLEYMLPNGSSAPILIGFIPESFWNN